MKTNLTYRGLLRVLFALLLTAPLSAGTWLGTAASTHSQQVQALYREMQQAGASISSGVTLQRRGSESQGKRKLDAGMRRLHVAAMACSKLSGCDSARFFSLYQTLLSQHIDGSAHQPQADPKTDALERIAHDERTIGAELPHMRTTLSLLNGRKLKEVITLNQQVKAAIDEWLTWKRPMLIETYKNYAYMRPLMLPAYQQGDLPEALLFGILAKESFARVHSVSRAGAAGPLQFMPATGERYGLGSSSGFDTRFDPELAARANAAYLNEQLGRLNQDLALTLAAYNGGEGRVGRLAEQNQRKDFWSDQIYYALPEETRDYVPGVLAAAYLFLHPEEFNLQFPQIKGATVESRLNNAMSLSELSMCLGQQGREDGWFRTLRNLNPRVRAENRMAAGTKVKLPEAAMTAYRQHCDDPKFMAKVADLHDSAHPSGGGFVPYVVRTGDTLAAIARRTQCINVSALASLNSIAAPRFAIKPGQRIKLPACG